MFCYFTRYIERKLFFDTDNPMTKGRSTQTRIAQSAQTSRSFWHDSDFGEKNNEWFIWLFFPDQQYSIHHSDSLSSPLPSLIITNPIPNLKTTLCFSSLSLSNSLHKSFACSTALYRISSQKRCVLHNIFLRFLSFDHQLITFIFALACEESVKKNQI